MSWEEFDRLRPEWKEFLHNGMVGYTLNETHNTSEPPSESFFVKLAISEGLSTFHTYGPDHPSAIRPASKEATKESNMNVYAFAFAGPTQGALIKFVSRKAALSSGNGFTLAVDADELARSANSLTAMADFYNTHQLPENRIKKFTDKATAAKRLIALAEAKAELREAPSDDELRPAAASAKAPKAPKEKKSGVAPGRGRKSEYLGKKLYPSTDCKGENPRRAGTGGFKSMSIILADPGITFEDFIKKGGRGVDLRWDLGHGWAVVE